MTTKQHNDDNSEKQDLAPKVYSYLDFIQFEPSQKNSSLGKMVLSNLKSQPQFSIGTSERKKILKQFISKELAKTNLISRESIGPNYNQTDKYMYDKNPEYKIGTSQRKPLSVNEVFDYFQRIDVDFDPIEAEKYRRESIKNVRIGLENRFQSGPKLMRGTPGPQYNPNLKQEIEVAPKYTFGHRRNIPGVSCLQPLISTPNVVGPGSYIIQTKPDTSDIKTDPKYSFVKSQRHPLRNQDWTLSQTYSLQNSIGQQASSHRTSMPQVSIGKSTRDAKTGHFKQYMATQPTQVRISMPQM